MGAFDAIAAPPSGTAALRSATIFRRNTLRSTADGTEEGAPDGDHIGRKTHLGRRPAPGVTVAFSCIREVLLSPRRGSGNFWAEGTLLEATSSDRRTLGFCEAQSSAVVTRTNLGPETSAAVNGVAGYPLLQLPDDTAARDLLSAAQRRALDPIVAHWPLALR